MTGPFAATFSPKSEELAIFSIPHSQSTGIFVTFLQSSSTVRKSFAAKERSSAERGARTYSWRCHHPPRRAKQWRNMQLVSLELEIRYFITSATRDFDNIFW